jgi:hypothetical protein
MLQNPPGLAQTFFWKIQKWQRTRISELDSKSAHHFGLWNWWFPWNFRMFDMRHGTMINFQWWMWPTCSWLKRQGSTDQPMKRYEKHIFSMARWLFLKWVGHNMTGPGSNSGQGSVQQSWKERGTSRSSVTLELGLDLQGPFMPLTQVLSIDWLL